MSDDTQVVGVAMVIRGGDRLYQAQYIYQDMATPPPGPSLTALGQQQELQLGTLLRSIYLDESSPSFIQGLSGNTDVYNSTEVIIRADGSAEGEAIPDSAVALGQGLWPPTSSSSIKLANGTTVTGPFGGYQYTLVNSVSAAQDYTLRGQTYCNMFLNRAQSMAVGSNSQLQLQALANDVSQSMPQIQAAVPLDFDPDFPLEYLGEVYDYMNTQSIHNTTFLASLPNGLFDQVQDWNNQLANLIFTDPSPTGIGNIAGRSVLTDVNSGLSTIAVNVTGVRMYIDVIDWQPFLGLMNVTGVFESGDVPVALVDYAAALVFELRNDTSGDLTVRMKFKNGTTDDNFRTLPMIFGDWNGSGGKDVPFETFEDAFLFNGIRNWTVWCNACEPSGLTVGACLIANFTSPSGADTTGSEPPSSTSSVEVTSTLDASARTRISPVGAGFLGAGLTIAVLSAVFGFLMFLGVFSYGGLRRARRPSRVSWRRDRKMRGDEVELHSEARSYHLSWQPHAHDFVKVNSVVGLSPKGS
ncbi:hypothetical protein EIP86_010632 [Pleurotus ostreatoroseus]|nr:hypothetical protein EIP86_010632 [Pleurotus ostreatoroseus]